MHEATVRAGQDFLAHYGVKGMKWGVTRSNPSGGTTGSNRSISSDARQAQKSRDRLSRHGSTDVLSNRDLQDLVTRMNLEQNYNRLKNMEPTAFDRAKRFTSGVGTTARTMNNVIAFVNSPAGKLLRKFVGL